MAAPRGVRPASSANAMSEASKLYSTAVAPRLSPKGSAEAGPGPTFGRSRLQHAPRRSPLASMMQSASGIGWVMLRRTV